MQCPCCTIRNTGEERQFQFHIVIPENHFAYWFFNFLVSCLCIVSSYFYLFLAANRYPPTEDSKAELSFVIIFESIFLIHMLL